MRREQVFWWWVRGRDGLLKPTRYRATEAEIRARHPDAQRIPFDWRWREEPEPPRQREA